MLLPWLDAHDRTAQAEALRSTSMAALVREEVLGLILDGTLQPGQRINEPDMAQRLGVSRVPVREALRELHSSGLVVTRKHAGVFVREPDAAELRELYDIRAMFDSHAGRAAAALPAAQRRALHATLRDTIATMADAARRHAVAEYYRANLQFHWALVEVGGNTSLTQLYQGVVQRVHLARLRNLARVEGMQASIAEHRAIAAAVRAGRVDEAGALMDAHVRGAFTRLEQPAEPAPRPARPRARTS